MAPKKIKNNNKLLTFNIDIISIYIRAWKIRNLLLTVNFQKNHKIIRTKKNQLTANCQLLTVN